MGKHCCREMRSVALSRVPRLLQRACSTQAARDFDIVVIGGGVPGSCLAALLGNTSTTSALKICVLDAGPSPSLHTPPEKNDIRVSAVAPSSARILQEAGAWDQIEDQERLAAYTSMQVWDGAGGGSVSFSAEEIGEHELGYVVENAIMQGALHDVLRARTETVELLARTKCSSVKFPDQNTPAAPAEVVAVGQDGVELLLRARLVVAADGWASAVKQPAGIPGLEVAYGQTGVVATVKTSWEHEIAWQRFLPDHMGVLALLPAPQGLSSIVWSTSNASAARLKALPPQDFIDTLNRTLNEQLPSGVYQPPEVTALSSPVVGFPLRAGVAASLVSHRLSLVGDAAHMVHPLAGQGLNLGISDARDLARALERGVSLGMDIGDAELVLRQYHESRAPANAGMALLMHSLRSCFDVSFGPFVAARSAGMSALNAAGPLKRTIAQLAMGQL